MEPIGIEPTTSCMPCKRSPNDIAENKGLSEGSAPVCTPVCTSDAEDEHGSTPEATKDSPELAAVVEMWPSLPEAIRADILAMVRTALGRQ